MKMNKPLLTFVFIIYTVSVAFGSGAKMALAAQVQEPWYVDIGSHWAYQYVRVLWEENVTDGRVKRVSGKERSYYMPDNEMTRGQFATLLSKVFQCEPLTPSTPSYPDVPKTYQILAGKRAWAYIEGLLGANIATVPPGQKFRPDKSICREDAVSFLIGALGLLPEAESLDSQEVKSILRCFRDWSSVSLDNRPIMACAIKYGIIDGYEDDTLRPSRKLSRAEGATIVSRSCMIRATAPRRFSPDNDGINDVLCIQLGFLKNRGIVSWQVSIFSKAGWSIVSLNPDNDKGNPPDSVTWDGKDSRGQDVPEGTYYYQAYVWDKAGRSHLSIRKPVELIRHSLSASLVPSSVKWKDQYTVSSFTNPQASTVWILINGKKTTMSSKNGTSWLKTMIADLPTSSQEVVVHADFPECSRQVTLELNVVDPMWIHPGVIPGRAVWGDSLRLTCRASLNVETVTAYFFGQTIPLMFAEDEAMFCADTRVPENTPIGVHPILFIGRGKKGSVRKEVGLAIAATDLYDVRFILIR
jgi:hypothetical protein